jgi:hypothetical protein
MIIVEMTCAPLALLFCIIYRGARTPSIHNEFKLDEPPHTPFNNNFVQPTISNRRLFTFFRGLLGPVQTSRRRFRIPFHELMVGLAPSTTWPEIRHVSSSAAPVQSSCAPMVASSDSSEKCPVHGRNDVWRSSRRTGTGHLRCGDFMLE